MPKSATALDAEDKERFGAWLRAQVDDAMAGDEARTYSAFLREHLGSANYSTSRVSRYFTGTLPAPDMLRAMCGFWRIHSAEALFRCGYISDFFVEVLALDKRDATCVLVAFFPLRGERPQFAGPRFDDRESIASWLGLTTSLAPPTRRRRSIPHLLKLAARASVDRDLDPDVRRFTAAHYVREFVLAFNPREAAAIVATIHHPPSAVHFPMKTARASPYIIGARHKTNKRKGKNQDGTA